MKRKPYFPRIISEQPEWFRNFREELAVANAILTMPAPDVTKRSADAPHLEHASGISRGRKIRLPPAHFEPDHLLSPTPITCLNGDFFLYT